MISLVVPAFNEEAYIGSCLRSIERELRDFDGEAEVLVINNASTDRTKELAQEFPFVTVIDEPRKGLGWARQAGYLAAKYELIANVDADTMLTRGWFRTVIAEFEKNPQLAGLSGPYIYHELSAHAQTSVTLFYRVGALLAACQRRLFRTGSMLQGGNFVMRKSAMRDAGGFDTSITFYGEDTYIAQQLERIGEVKFTFDLPVYSSARRFHQEGLAAVGWKYAMNYFSVTYRKKPHTKEAQHIRQKQLV